jgi:5'-nucleotidase
MPDVRILVANDDGIDAPGLAALADAAQRLSPDVWIVAPERKWTAASHQLTFDRDQTLTRVRERVYACSGAPADCVVAAMALLMPEGARPGLVLAGINDKPNVGEDLAYSGTTAIAREAAFWHVPAIAFSRAAPASASAADHDALCDLLATLWSTRDAWALDGHWLAVNLPPALPAPIVQPGIGRDKIGGACDVIRATDDRITYRLRRGRPGTAGPGDENACLAAGAIGVQRFRWDAQSPLPDAIVAAWQAGGKMAD